MRTAVEVFKTNVVNEPAAAKLVTCLEAILLHAKVNFDLEDCDHILRVEAPRMVDVALVRDCVLRHGYEAEQLR